MAGRVNQVEAIFLAVVRSVMQANAFGFDGDAALALEVHRIEHLLVHLALAERAGEFEKAVGKRGFAVVDVRDDAKISDVAGVHQFLTGQFPCASVLLIVACDRRAAGNTCADSWESRMSRKRRPPRRSGRAL